MENVWSWIIANGITLVAIGWSVEKVLRLIDKLLPEHIKIDNNLADYLAKLLTIFKKKG